MRRRDFQRYGEVSVGSEGSRSAERTTPSNCVLVLGLGLFVGAMTIGTIRHLTSGDVKGKDRHGKRNAWPQTELKIEFN